MSLLMALACNEFQLSKNEERPEGRYVPPTEGQTTENIPYTSDAILRPCLPPVESAYCGIESDGSFDIGCRGNLDTFHLDYSNNISSQFGSVDTFESGSSLRTIIAMEMLIYGSLDEYDLGEEGDAAGGDYVMLTLSGDVTSTAYDYIQNFGEDITSELEFDQPIYACGVNFLVPADEPRIDNLSLSTGAGYFLPAYSYSFITFEPNLGESSPENTSALDLHLESGTTDYYQNTAIVSPDDCQIENTCIFSTAEINREDKAFQAATMIDQLAVDPIEYYYDLVHGIYSASVYLCNDQGSCVKYLP